MSNESNNQDTSAEQALQFPSSSAPKKKTRSLLIILCVFVGFVTIVFLTQKKEMIDWVEDYQAGLEQARKQNKPVLLAFYKLHTRFCSLMDQNTYNNPEVKKYVEETFVPVLIDVDKQPEIARKFKIDYYPTHYVKFPDSSEMAGPQMGYDVPNKFIQILEEFLEQLKQAEK